MALGQTELRRPHPWRWLILLTLVAGCLRFYAIDKPSVWGDEAATWRRISGTYQQLVDELRIAGFMPGHYVLTWWIKDGFPVWGRYESSPPSVGPDIEGRFLRQLGDLPDPSRSTRMVWMPTVRLIDGGITPTPLMLRFVPALCGTLMVPAIYFLASRLVARRTALLAALFTCCSAYMLNYSRDAKMYMQFWFFATLHVGCLLWWLEAYRRPRVIDPTLVPPRQPKADDLGAGVANILPAAHIAQMGAAFNDHVPRATLEKSVSRLSTLVRFACWLTAGLAMIAFHAVGLAIVGIELIIVLATIPQRVGWIGSLAARLTGRGHDDGRYDELYAGRSILSRICIPPVLSFLVGATCVVMLFTSYREFTRFYSRVEPATTQSTQFDVDDAGIGWVEPYNRGRTAESHFLENATAYLFNWEWARPADMQYVKPETLKRLRIATAVLLGALAIGLFPWRGLLARMMGSPPERGPMPATALFILTVWLLVPAYGIYAASGAWAEKGERVRAVPPVSTMAMAIFPEAAPGDVEPLRGAVMKIVKPVFTGDKPWETAKEQLAALPWRELFVVKNIDAAAPRWWVLLSLGGLVLFGALAWQRQRLVLPTVDDRFGAKLAIDEEAEARSLRRRRATEWWWSLLLRGLALSLALVLLVLMLVATFAIVPAQGRSVWMPRYLGFVWPAFAIIACVLIQRLPLLPLRWLVIAALLAVNLTNYAMRLKHGEPPTAEIARDMIAARDAKTARLFAPVVGRRPFGGPGSGGVFSMPANYYYITMSDTPITPRETYLVQNQQDFVVRFGGNFGNSMRARLGREPMVDEIYVWAQMPASTAAGEVEATITRAIGPSWKAVDSPKRWMIYDHWTWQELHVLERHHLKRDASLATKPATRPASTGRPAKAPEPNIIIKQSTRPASRAATTPSTQATRPN